MESEALRLAASQGLWAVLFVTLLFYVLRTNATRESKYQVTIDTLAERLGDIEVIKKDVAEIKIDMKTIGRN